MKVPLQKQTNGIPDRAWDALVVGAGPAGSMAALHLARLGHSVLLVDKAEFPREKVCGDGLITDSLNCLKRAGLYDEVSSAGYSLTRAVIFSPSRVELEVEGECITLKRIRLDEIVARGAVSEGAVFCRAAVEDISADEGGVTALLDGRESMRVRAKVAFLATGADVSLLQKFGMVERRSSSAFALRCYVRSALPLDRLIFTYDKSILPGYAWIFPLGSGEFNVGCGIFNARQRSKKVNLKRAFQTFVTEFPLARELMRVGEALSPLRGAMLRCGLSGTSPSAFSHVLGIGESIGTTFPFSGEGIGKAMETGEMAAHAVHEALGSGNEQALSDFLTRVRQTLHSKYLAYEAAEKWLSRPWLNDLVFRRARRSRFLRECLSGIAAETTDPRDVFSVKGLMRSFLG